MISTAGFPEKNDISPGDDSVSGEVFPRTASGKKNEIGRMNDRIVSLVVARKVSILIGLIVRFPIAAGVFFSSIFVAASSRNAAAPSKTSMSTISLAVLAFLPCRKLSGTVASSSTSSRIAKVDIKLAQSGTR